MDINMLEELRKKANNLPMKPGVYIMMDSSRDVIYVGKAKLLKNRVSSYFHGAHNDKTETMVSKVSDFDIIVANSEFEALVLENSLIKHHMPQYNILLKDDKGYPFIRLDIKSEYPTFSVVPATADDGAMYFGPFGGRGATFSVISSIQKALKLPSCSRKFPADIGKARPCLNYHIGTCRGYCLRDTPRSEHKKAIDEAVLILEGKMDKLILEETCLMEQAAEKLMFEAAAEHRDRIKALSQLSKQQYVWTMESADTDAVGFSRGQGRSCFVVLHYIEGRLLDKEFRFLENPMENDCEAVEAIVRQYYEQRGVVPRNVLLPCGEDLESLQQLLTEKAGRKVNVTVPKRGDKLRLVETANINAAEEIARVTTREERVTKTAEWLQKALSMERPPLRIEAFDISNTGDSDIVASMVTFYQGRPLKKAYRRFKIKTTSGQDDYHSMVEVVSRRIERYLAGDEKFSDLPDLMLIDGGATHASAAKGVLDDVGIDLPVFGMVKDDRHKTRALVSPDGREIGISAQPSAFALIGSIQEETHRFAIEYHRKLRSKSTLYSRLDGINGVGPARKNALLREFKSLKAIGSATVEELSRVVPKNTALEIYNAFHKESGE